ncbi:TetR/AcrR family transcriptional regulator [Paenalkalicoccus suaedae]|uniref:TetR/AcrR family transcriptional regulator n=1 Tax=Paenalkalicoccus suaedae TaxID=2592382 RepID=A0A859FJQ1_9BACI|nr:TetR/AcrR family transcriptional regulator [Paenalkalicoccus suaedae]QKS73034.1 TetR/AcrR family transcriptional regulator [Paenalkalicoccus suaedae]
MAPKLSENKKEENKELLAAKALQVFKSYGYHETSMSLIAKEAGFSKGGIYAYFDSKEDLFLHMLKTILDQKHGVLDESFSEATYYEQLLTQWSRIFMSWSELDRNHLKLVFEFWLQASDNPLYREKLLENYYVSEEYFIKLLNRGKEKGELNSLVNPALMSQLFWSLIDGQVHFWIVRDKQPSKQELDELYEQLRLLLKGLKKP